MYPQSFEYIAPKSVSEAIEFLKKHEGEAKILAGGQSLIPLMKMRFASFPYLVDITGISDLHVLKRDGELLKIGSLVRTAELEDSQVVKNELLILAEAASQIADPQVRNMGTVGGNCVHGDPGNDLPSVMLALDARYTLKGPNGSRQISASDFYLDTYTTGLEEGELLTEIEIRKPAPSSGGAYVKHRRRSGDFSVAAVAAYIVLDETGMCKKAGLGVTSMGPTNFRAVKAEAFLAGKRLSEENIENAIEQMISEAKPSDDGYGTAEFKIDILRLVAQEAIHKAIDRAMGV